VRGSTVPILLLAALAFFAGLGRGAITDSDEAFYAESAREMVESGNWLTPHFNYEPRFQKPVLYYWLTAASYWVIGTTEFAARMWSALAGVGLALLTAACGRRWFDEVTALLAGAIVATNFGYFALARMALPDLALAFFITLSITAAFVATLERERHPRRWLLLAALAAALGFLAKGPLAVVIPLLVVMPIVLLERRSLNVRLGDVLPAALVFIVIAGPWYVAMWWEHGTPYLSGFFVGDNYERFATTRFNEPRPWWFYLPVIAGGLLPWTCLLLVWVGPVWQFLTRRRDIGTVDLRLLLWAILPLLFFTISIGKQPRYILPLMPPVALLLASSIIERTREWRSLDGARFRPRPNGAVVTGCILSGLFLITLAVLLYRVQPLFVDVSESVNLAVAATIGGAGASVVLISLTRAWRAAPGVLALAAALIFALLPYGTVPATDQSAVRKVADALQNQRARDAPIATYGVFGRNLVFYTREKHVELTNDEHLAAWLAQNPRGVVVMKAADANRVERERSLTLERIVEVAYFNEGGIKVRTLLWPNPSQDLEKVVLVRVR